MATNLNLRHRAAHDPDCVLDWRIDGACSPPCFIPDLSGHNNHGQSNNMDSSDLVVGPREGFALDFDGSNDFVTIPNESLLGDITDEISVALWARIDVLNKGICGRCTDTNWDDGWGIYHRGADGKLRFWVDHYLNNAGWILFSDTTSWHHIVGTYSKSNGRVRIYVDGVKGTDDSYSTSLTPGGTFMIGCLGGGAYQNGGMSGVKIWRRELSQGEIQHLYDCGSLPQEAGRLRRRRKLRA